MKKKKHIKKSWRKEIARIITYSITGGIWFWSGYAMFALCYGVLGWDIVPAKVFSYLFGLVVNFLLERFWVFRGKDARKQLDKVTARYVILSGANLVIDTFIVWGLDRIGITPYIGQFVSAGFFTVWNYIWYRLWVFARGKKVAKPRRAAAPVLHRTRRARYQPRRA